MNPEGKLVNCTNYFNEIGKDRLKEALEAGETVRAYIDCMGQARAYTEGCRYERWLADFYGDRLVVGRNAFGETTYCLSDRG